VCGVLAVYQYQYISTHIDEHITA